MSSETLLSGIKGIGVIFCITVNVPQFIGSFKNIDTNVLLTVVNCNYSDIVKLLSVLNCGL